MENIVNYILLRYRYQSADESGSVGIYGLANNYLHGGGYVVDIPLYLHLVFLLLYPLYSLVLKRNANFTDSFLVLVVSF